jgi:galactitol-specific phosphotransferase system IIC component
LQQALRRFCLPVLPGGSPACSFTGLWIGDKFAPAWQKHFGLEGTTCTTIYYIRYLRAYQLAREQGPRSFPAIDKIAIDPKTYRLNSSYRRACHTWPARRHDHGPHFQTVHHIHHSIGVGVAVAIVLCREWWLLLMEGMSPIPLQLKNSCTKGW